MTNLVTYPPGTVLGEPLRGTSAMPRWEYPRPASADALRDLAVRQVLGRALWKRDQRAANAILGAVTQEWEALTGTTWAWYGWIDLPRFANEG